MGKKSKKQPKAQLLPKKQPKALFLVPLLAIVAILAVGFGGYRYVTAQVLVNDLAERKAVFTDFLKQAENVAKTTGDKQAKAVLEYLNYYAVIVKPQPEGVMFLEQGKSDKWIGIMPMMEKDVVEQKETKIGEYLRNLFENCSFSANYLPDQNVIVLRDQMSCTDIWKGLVLLHEGNHALTMANAPYDWHDLKIFSAAEAETHIFENGLIEKLGGQPYADFLKKQIADIKANERERKTPPCEEFPTRTGNYPELDEIFGRPLSQFEDDLRGTHVWLDIVFRIIDEDCQTPPKTKAGLLRVMYEEDGILPAKS
jgi:hypothetical protein